MVAVGRDAASASGPRTVEHAARPALHSAKVLVPIMGGVNHFRSSCMIRAVLCDSHEHMTGWLAPMPDHRCSGSRHYCTEQL